MVAAALGNDLRTNGDLASRWRYVKTPLSWSNSDWGQDIASKRADPDSLAMSLVARCLR